MPTIDVHVHRDGDPPMWPSIELIEHLPDSTWYLVALENGMTSGKPSLMLRLDLPSLDGSVIAETSLAVWIAATCALRGAFPDAFAGTPLA